jgi:hypothetical protein
LLPAVVFFFMLLQLKAVCLLIIQEMLFLSKQIMLPLLMLVSLEVLKLNGNKLEIIADERVTNSLFKHF